MDLIVDFPEQPRVSRTRRCVTFDTQLEMKFVECLATHNDLKSNLWSSKKEMKMYKYNFALSVKEMKTYIAAKAEEKLPKDIDTDNFVGLENFLTETSHIEVQERRSAQRRAVMMEQQRQDNIGICDPDALAAVSAKASAWARERAQVFATIHAKR